MAHRAVARVMRMHLCMWQSSMYVFHNSLDALLVPSDEQQLASQVHSLKHRTQTFPQRRFPSKMAATFLTIGRKKNTFSLADSGLTQVDLHAFSQFTDAISLHLKLGYMFGNGWTMFCLDDSGNQAKLMNSPQNVYSLNWDWYARRWTVCLWWCAKNYWGPSLTHQKKSKCILPFLWHPVWT